MHRDCVGVAWESETRVSKRMMMSFVGQDENRQPKTCPVCKHGMT